MSGYPARRKQLSITLDPATFDKLNAMADASGISRSQLVETALAVFIERQASLSRRRRRRPAS